MISGGGTIGSPLSGHKYAPRGWSASRGWGVEQGRPSGRAVACPGFGGREVHLRLYRALLVLFPRSFRRGYREPMLQLFGDCVRARGAKTWLRTVPDLIRTV